MSLADFFDRIGNNFATNFDNGGGQGLASLGAAIASAPRNQWGAGIAQGLGQFKQIADANKKKASLAEALKGVSGGMTPQQQQFLAALEPDQQATILGSQLFKSGGNSWQAKDIDGDGKPDIQVDNGSGKVESYPLSYKDRAYNMMFESGVSPIAPGLGVDPRGNIVPSPTGPATAPPPPPAAPAPMPTARPPVPPQMAQLEANSPAAVPTVPTPVVSAPANNAAPDPAQYIPLAGDALKRMNLGEAAPGKQWAIDKKTLQPLQIEIPGGSPKPTEAQQKAGYLYQEMKTASKLALDDPKALSDYMGFWNGLKRESSKTEFLSSPAAQVYRTAGKQWVTNMLYLKSGAQAGPAEIENNQEIYIPQWGDDPARVEYKKHARDAAESALSGALTPEQKDRANAEVERITLEAKKALAIGNTPPQEAIQYLRMNPKFKADFDEKYGTGAADRYLKVK